MVDKNENKEQITEDGTRRGEITTDVVESGGIKLGDIVFAVHDRNEWDKPLSDIRKAPAIVTAVNGDKVNGEQRINVQVFHDSNDIVWFENITLYDDEAEDDEEHQRRFNQGVYATKDLSN